MLKQQITLNSAFFQTNNTEFIANLANFLKDENSQLKLVSTNGKEVIIPESLSHLLRDIIEVMAAGQAIHLIPQNHELTTQEAADILNVSRPFLIKLLEQGEIPYIKVGTHRRIRFEDLITYKEQRDMKRSQILTELIQLSQEAGFYQ